MEVINKKIKSTLTVALILTFLLPCGILMIIFGAIKAIFLIMGLGIACVAAGFYVMPIMWVKFGDLRGYKFLLTLILEDIFILLKSLQSRAITQKRRQWQTSTIYLKSDILLVSSLKIQKG